MKNIYLTIALAGCMVACSPKPKVVVEYVEIPSETIPGVVHDYWEEPIYNTVKVPAALDPEGNYYRPSHETVVEVRQGRVQPVQYENTAPGRPAKPVERYGSSGVK